MPKRLKSPQQLDPDNTIDSTLTALGHSNDNRVTALGHAENQRLDALGYTHDKTLDALGHAGASTLDALGNPLPSFNGSTSLTHIDAIPARRPGQNLTDEQRLQVQAIFLEEFSKRSNLTDAARQAGIDRTLVYYWLQHDSNFADGYAVAEQQANDALRREAWRRATDGVSEPIVSMGKLVRDEDTGQPMTVQKYDTPLLMMLMRARMPEYRDSRQVTVDSNIQVNTSHQLTIDTRGMSQDDLQAIRAIAQRMKDQEQARIEKTGKHDAGE